MQDGSKINVFKLKRHIGWCRRHPQNTFTSSYLNFSLSILRKSRCSSIYLPPTAYRCTVLVGLCYEAWLLRRQPLDINCAMIRQVHPSSLKIQFSSSFVNRF